MGNHEHMNLIGDWRYVSEKDIESFGGEDKRKEALKAGTPYGDYLRQMKIAHQIGDTIFVHGGISVKTAKEYGTL